jgi:DNA-binding MarR family transcriptional regulator
MNLETYFPYQLASTAEAFSRQLVQVYGRTYGLSREEWRLLFLLASAGQLNSLQLAQRTTLDKVQVSRAATRLENKGLISRAVADSDRRLRQYTCTEAGKCLFKEVFPAVQSCANSILGHMSDDDMNKLKDGLRALERAVAQYGQDQVNESS